MSEERTWINLSILDYEGPMRNIGKRARPYYISSYEFYKNVRALMDELDRECQDVEDRWNCIVGYFSKIEQLTAKSIQVMQHGSES